MCSAGGGGGGGDGGGGGEPTPRYRASLPSKQSMYTYDHIYAYSG